MRNSGMENYISCLNDVAAGKKSITYIALKIEPAKRKIYLEIAANRGEVRVEKIGKKNSYFITDAGSRFLDDWKVYQDFTMKLK